MYLVGSMSYAEQYALYKALHMIGWASWMAGIFYLGRLQVYMAEADDLESSKGDILKAQYALMQKRVYNIILIPAILIAWTFGTWMLTMNWDGLMQQPWMHAKLTFLVLFTGYTHYAKGIMKKQIAGTSTLSSSRLRQLNEFPTLVLVGVIFLAIFKNGLNATYAIVGFILFAVLLQMGIKLYKRKK